METWVRGVPLAYLIVEGDVYVFTNVSIGHEATVTNKPITGNDWSTVTSSTTTCDGVIYVSEPRQVYSLLDTTVDMKVVKDEYIYTLEDAIFTTSKLDNSTDIFRRVYVEIVAEGLTMGQIS